MKAGDLIAVNDNLYDYVGFDEEARAYKVAVVDIDEDGNLTNTHNTWYLTEKELDDGFNKIALTEDQWYGVVAHIIRQNHDVTEEEIDEATEDIVGRCFRMNMPQFNELEEYIACYMNR